MRRIMLLCASFMVITIVLFLTSCNMQTDSMKNPSKDIVASPVFTPSASPTTIPTITTTTETPTPTETPTETQNNNQLGTEKSIDDSKKQNKSLNEWNQIKIEQANGKKGTLFLGMTLNDFNSLDLYNTDFEITETVKLDKGETAIWTPILSLIFDTEGILYRITVNGELLTPIGIKNGDSKDLLEKFLGKSDATYKSDSAIVEEYKLRDSFFYADISENKIKIWGVSKYKYDYKKETPTPSPAAKASPTAIEKSITEQKQQLTLDSWIGNYTFSEFVPPDQNMFYGISIYSEKNKYYAKINIDGFQTIHRLQAIVERDENSIKFVFNEYLPDNIYEPYNVNDILLSFERKSSDLYTYWGKIQPIQKENNQSGKIYFKFGL